MPNPTIDRRAIWRRLMDRAAASQRTPTIHEPAGHEFRPELTPELVESLPAEAQTELALQLTKLVLDTNRLPKRRIIPAPVPIDPAKARAGFKRLLKVGRYGSRQGPGISFAIREGALAIPESDSPPLLDNGVVRNGSVDELLITTVCVECGTHCVNPATMTRVGGDLVCPVCAETELRECPRCHKHELWHFMRRGPTEPICRHCAEELMTSCPNCGDTCERGRVRSGRCPSCVKRDFIRPYSHKPAPDFFADPANLYTSSRSLIVPCLGVELETELPRSVTDCAVHAYDVVGDKDSALIYAKHDGSLNYGVEYVSHPFSWAWLMGGGKDIWGDFLRRLRESKHSSYDPGTCGMHVHVTKQPFLGHTLGRLLRLAHDCPQLFLQLSRRKESDLIQWANPRGGDPALFANIASGRIRSPTKYTAINVTDKTIEFRLFRGTLNTSSFLGNLEAVKAMLDFCDTAQPLTAQAFFAHINANAAGFPNLLALLRPVKA